MKSYNIFESELKKLEQEIADKKIRDKIQTLLDAAKNYRKEQGKVFELITKTNKSLYQICE